MAQCKGQGCSKEIGWMDTFPGDVCVDCHRNKVDGQDATSAYGEMMGNFKGNVIRVQELRRSNAATPVPSKKTYKRKPKNQKAKDERQR
jgi:hypothetical protein